MRTITSSVFFGQTVLAGAAGSWAVAAGAEADVLLHQIHDGRDGITAYGGMNESYAWAGDDITLEHQTRLDRATFWMLMHPEYPPSQVILNFYGPHSPGSGVPAEDEFHTVEHETSIVDLGKYSIGPYHVYEVRFESLDLTLKPGRYWLSPVAWGTGVSGPAYWATGCGAATVQGEGAYYDWYWGFWYPVDDLLGYPTDLAMKVEGTVLGK